MARYFKITEINKKEYIDNMGCDLDCLELYAHRNGAVYVGVDEKRSEEIQVALEDFPKKRGQKSV